MALLLIILLAVLAYLRGRRFGNLLRFRYYKIPAFAGMTLLFPNGATLCGMTLLDLYGAALSGLLFSQEGQGL